MGFVIGVNMHRAIVIDIRTGERIDVIESIGLEYVVVYCDYDPGEIS